MSESQQHDAIPSLSDIFNHLLQWYRNPVTGKNLTVREVAMRTPGVSIHTLYSIKQGREENPGYEVIEAIAAAFGVPPLILFPRLWDQTFTIPPNIKGFRPFPRAKAFTWAEAESDDPEQSKEV